MPLDNLAALLLRLSLAGSFSCRSPVKSSNHAQNKVELDLFLKSNLQFLVASCMFHGLFFGVSLILGAYLNKIA